MKLMNTSPHQILVTNNPALQVQGLSKSFNDHLALSNIDFSLNKGEILALLGPSGCGKTTLLRCIAGLHTPTSGVIAIEGEKVFDGAHNAMPEKRRLGMVFQDYALWPHMTVAENVAFPLIMQSIPKRQRQEKVAWALEVVGLPQLADRAPDTLSGGQQQRIALARAIVAEPRLLLMDEPLSNLDQSLRDALALEIRSLIKRLNLTAVFVTHDQHEAFAMADKVAVLQHGELQQFDTAQKLYQSPANPAIASFLDAGIQVTGELIDHTITFHDEVFPPLSCSEVHGYQGKVTLLIPRRNLFISKSQGVKLQQPTLIFSGESYQLTGLLGEQTFVRLSLDDSVDISNPIFVSFKADQLHGWNAHNQPIALRMSVNHSTNLFQMN